ncbi:MAG: ankyrin repeat domain-containing protein [Pseudomonadota bacterium]
MVLKSIFSRGKSSNDKEPRKLSVKEAIRLIKHLKSTGTLDGTKVPADKNINVSDERGNSPLTVACSSWANVETIKQLINLGADPNFKPEGNLPPLVCAMTHYTGHETENNILEIAKAMIEKGLDVNSVYSGNSLIAEAAYYDLPELCRLLVENGAIIDNPESQNPVDPKAAGENALRVLCELSNTDFDALMASTKPTLHSILRLAPEEKVDVNYRDSTGETPLHMIVQYSEAGLAAELIEMEADINAKDDCGRTPLHFSTMVDEACWGSDGDESFERICETVMVLIEAGADVDAKNNDDQTVLNMAEENSSPDFTARLKKHIEAQR